MIEGVPNIFFWVYYEDALLRFGFEIGKLKLFHISIATQILRNDGLGFLPNHSSYSVVSTDLDGALFNMNAVVSNAQSQNCSGKSVRDIIDCTISTKVWL